MENKINTYNVIRMKDLPKKIGYQPSTIYELIAKGKFPAPFKLVQGGRAAGWLETTIDDWIADREQFTQNEHSK